MGQIAAYLWLYEEGSDGSVGTRIETDPQERRQTNIADVDPAGAIEVMDIDAAVLVGIERRSAQSTGDRTFEPIKIRKMIDSTSPDLMRLACRSPRIGGEIKFFRPTTETGGFEHFYTIVFSDARVQEIRMVLPEGLENARVQEDVSFAYSKCKWTHPMANKEFEDDFTVRPAA